MNNKDSRQFGLDLLRLCGVDRHDAIAKIQVSYDFDCDAAPTVKLERHVRTSDGQLVVLDDEVQREHAEFDWKPGELPDEPT